MIYGYILVIRDVIEYSVVNCFEVGEINLDNGCVLKIRFSGRGLLGYG